MISYEVTSVKGKLAVIGVVALLWVTAFIALLMASGLREAVVTCLAFLGFLRCCAIAEFLLREYDDWRRNR